MLILLRLLILAFLVIILFPRLKKLYYKGGKKLLMNVQKKELKMEQKDSKRFISPAGAGIVLICFFLPWVQFSCAGNTSYASGAKLGGPMWIVFAASIIILGSFFYFKSIRKLEQSKPIILISSIIGLIIIAYKYFDFASGMKTEFGTITPDDVGLTIQFGGIFTVIGLILSIIGSSFLIQENNDTEDVAIIEDKSDVFYCPDCGAKIDKDIKFCPECGSKID